MVDEQLIVPHVYAGNPLDRGERERRDEEWLDQMAKDPASRFLPLSNLDVLLVQASQQRLGWLDVAELTELGIDNRPVFLGLQGETAHFVIDVSGNERAVRELQEDDNRSFVDARAATESLSGPESGIVAQARAQINWHNRNGFCSI